MENCVLLTMAPLTMGLQEKHKCSCSCIIHNIRSNLLSVYVPNVSKEAVNVQSVKYNCSGQDSSMFIRVYQIDKMCPNFYSKFLIWWPIDLRTLGIFLFWSKNICWPPSRGVSTPKSGISKFSELYVVGTLHFCLQTPGTMQKESGQSDHPVKGNPLKHAETLGYLDQIRLRCNHVK